MPRTGKIARLPRHVRDELNLRLERREPGRDITEWINGLPEVQTILKDHFHEEPVNEQNLTNWRRTGFAEWQIRQEFFDRLPLFSEEATDLTSAAVSFTDHAARLLSIHFALALSPTATLHPPAATEDPTPPEPEEAPLATQSVPSVPSVPSFTALPIPTHLKPLCDITRAIVSLRRSEIAAARLKIHQDAHAPQPIDNPRLQLIRELHAIRNGTCAPHPFTSHTTTPESRTEPNADAPTEDAPQAPSASSQRDQIINHNSPIINPPPSPPSINQAKSRYPQTPTPPEPKPLPPWATPEPKIPKVPKSILAKF